MESAKRRSTSRPAKGRKVTEHAEAKGSIWTPGVPAIADTPIKTYALILVGIALSVLLAYLAVSGWQKIQADNYYAEANHRHMGQDLAGAKKGYKKALSLNPNHADANFGLAMIEADKDPRRAVERYKKAIALDPRNADYHAWLAFAYHNGLDKSAPAIGSMNKAIELEPENYQYRLAISAFMVNVGEVDGAIAHLEQVTRLAPAVSSAHEKLAGLYAERGEKDKARAHRAMIK
jgi:tetratricopeptide (TPR) repeat protein